MSTTTQGPRYRRLFKIGAGGMATVYLGRMDRGPVFSRLVAIKRAHPHLLMHAKLEEQLVREARLASAVRHPNVVTVWDIDLAGDEPLLVMDYVEGPSLSALCRAAPLPHHVALRILLDACRGLQAIHGAVSDDGTPLGLVHRDVSPHNVLVGVDGLARITDFGIAKSVHEATRTGSDERKGKLGYLPPEYLRDGRYDVRSDVFSMALVAWELLAGRRAYRGSHELMVLNKMFAEDLPMVSQLAPRLGSSFDDLIGRALSKNPAHRPASAGELADALETAALEAGALASHQEVADAVLGRWGEQRAERRRLIAEFDVEANEAVAAPSKRRWWLPFALAAAALAGAAWWLSRAGGEVRAAAPLAIPSPVISSEAAPTAASASEAAPSARPVVPRRKPAPTTSGGLPPNPYE